jgi:CRP-like cAMP-binding protein
MISPELLRRYPFFGALSDAQLKAIAQIAEEVSFEKGVTLFKECDPAEIIGLLTEGSIDLYYCVGEELNSETRKEFLVGEINPGEIFAVSALIDPYQYSATARAAQHSKVIKIEAAALRRLLEGDCDLGFKLMKQVAKTAMERLAYTRVQLAAAWT